MSKNKSVSEIGEKMMKGVSKNVMRGMSVTENVMRSVSESVMVGVSGSEKVKKGMSVTD